MDKDKPNLFSLPRADKPEDVGVSSKAILGFLDEIKEKDIELHSFMIVRHGKVAFSHWWAPYNEETPHTMFSVSKSLVSTAVGFAISEGLLNLDDKVYDFFPEYAPRMQGPFARILTVENLLTMTSGKITGLALQFDKPNWVKIYLNGAFVTKPGEVFNYSSDNTYMLSAIIHKVTGQNVAEYLYPRFFKPLGIEKPFWEKDPRGIDAGGWGARLTTEDLAKVIMCYTSDGRWNGVQILPVGWAREATRVHVTKTTGTGADRNSGYGYQFWRNSVDNSFRADGVFAQLACGLPDYDACLVTTGGETMERYVLETMWKYFPEGFIDEKNYVPSAEDESASDEIQKKLPDMRLPEITGEKSNPAAEEMLKGKLLKLPDSKKATILPFVCNFMRDKKSGYLNNICLKFDDGRLVMTCTEKYDDIRIVAGFGEEILSKVEICDYPYTMASSYAWQKDGSLEIWIRALENTQVKKLRFRFNGKYFRLDNWSERTVYNMAVFGLDFEGIKKTDPIKIAAKGAAGIVEPIVDPDLIGRIVKIKNI